MNMRILIPLALFLFMVQGAVADNWPMFHHDMGLSGYSTSIGPDTADVLWIKDFGIDNPFSSSPAVVDGVLFIGGTDGTLYALDEYSGSVLWTYPSGWPIISSPAVSEGIVFFLNEGGTVFALDASDGSLEWSENIGDGAWDWSSPTVNAGTVFVGSSTGTIFALDADDGSVIWSTPVGGQPNSQMSVAGGRVFTGTHNFNNDDPTLVALDESTGTIQWTYDYYDSHGVVGFVNHNGATVADGDGDGDLEVYFGVVQWSGPGPTVISLDATTGAEEWSSLDAGWSTSTPAYHDGMLFIGADDTSLYALDAITGAPLWNFPSGGPVWSAPAVADGKVYFGSLDHHYYCVDELTGDLIWEYDTGASRVFGSPALADGIAFFGNENGKIYAFRSTIPVGIDIKPGSYPNSINPGSRGLLPVAILGSDTFKVEDIKPESVELDGVGLATRGSSKNPQLAFSYEDVNADGYLDMMVFFNTHDLGLTWGTLEMTLHADLLNGMEIEGTDSVRIVPPQP